MGSIEEKVSKYFPCRTNEVKELINHLKNGWPSLNVSGKRGSGKSSIVELVLKELNYSFAWVDGEEISSAIQLMNMIINQFKLIFSLEDDITTIRSHTEFINELNGLLLEIENQKKKRKSSASKEYRLAIVLDSSHLLLNKDTGLLVLLYKLNEFLEHEAKITTIFISSHLRESFSKIPGYLQYSLDIYFKNYTQQDLFIILRRFRPNGYSELFYDKYVQS